MTRTHARYPSYVEDQRAFFDELVTNDWESYVSPEWDRARELEIDYLLDVAPARRILDVGCGCGYHDMVLADRPGVEEVVGIDYSVKSVEVAEREYPHPRVRRHAADVFAMPPGDFDLAVSFQVIEHLTDPVGFLRANARQVRPGGAVAVSTPNPRRLYNVLRRLLRLPPALEDPQHFREYTHGELRSLGRAAGLGPVETIGYGLHLVVPRLHWSLVPARFAMTRAPAVGPIADRILAVYRVPAT